MVSYLPSVGKFAFSDPGIYNVIGGWLPGAVPGWCHLWQRLHGGLQRLAQRPGAHADPCREDHHRRVGVRESHGMLTLSIHLRVSQVMGVPQKRWMVSFMENTMKMDDD